MKFNIFLILIIIIAALTRLPYLASFPNGFSADEAQQGYDSFSISQTGKDEWGQLLPINPRGFGDYKPPLYTYLSVPSIALFGLSIESVRIPAAIIGVLTVIAIYFLSNLLFQDKRVAILTAFLMAISPWHIQASRTAFEAGLGIFLFILGLVFFIKAGIFDQLSKLRNGYLATVIILWGLSMYTYHSFRVFILLFLVIIFTFFRKQFSLTNRIFICIIFSIFLIPIIVNISSTSNRLSDVGIFSDKVIQSYLAERSSSLFVPEFQKIVDNKFIFTGGVFLDNYLVYYSTIFLFSGARPDFSYLNFPGFPLFYIIELIFILSAVYFSLLKRLKRVWLVYIWLILAPIPAALTVGSMSTNRAIILLPAITILSGFGLIIFIDYIKNRFHSGKNLVQIVTILFLLLNFLYFGYFYLIKLPNEPPESLRFGYEQIFKEVLKRESQYDFVVIDKQTFTEPHIFVAFYGKVKPKILQESSMDWLRYEKYDKVYVDQMESYNLGKFLFEGVDWKNKDSQRKNSLIVASAESFPEGIISEFDVKNPRGKLIYRIVSTDKNVK